MEIAGHVSRQMLSRYAHIRTEAKRKGAARGGAEAAVSAPLPQVRPSPFKGRACRSESARSGGDIGWQTKAEYGALPRLGLGPNVSVMQFYDALANRQTNTSAWVSAARVQTFKQAEDVLRLLLIKADTIVI